MSAFDDIKEQFKDYGRSFKSAFEHQYDEAADRAAEHRFYEAVYKQESRRHDREKLNRWNSMSAAEKEQWRRQGIYDEFAPKWAELVWIDLEVQSAKIALMIQARANPTHSRIQSTVANLDAAEADIRKQQNDNEAKETWTWKDTLHHTFQPVEHTPLNVYGTGKDMYEAGKASIDAAKDKKDFASGFAAGFGAVMGAVDAGVRDTVPGMRQTEEILDPAVESWANKGPASVRRIKKLITLGYNPVQAFNTVAGTAFAAEDELRAALGLGKKDKNFEEFLDEMGMAPIWREIDNPAIGPVKAFRAAMMAMVTKRSGLNKAEHLKTIEKLRSEGEKGKEPSYAEYLEQMEREHPDSIVFTAEEYAAALKGLEPEQTLTRGPMEHTTEQMGDSALNAYDSQALQFTELAYKNDHARSTYAPEGYEYQPSLSYSKRAVWYNSATKEYYVSFRGTDPKSVADLHSDVTIGLGTTSTSARFQREAGFVRDLTSSHPDAQVHLSGHSLGGSVALYVNQEVRAAPNIVQCTAFNPGQNFFGNAMRAQTENVDPAAPYAQHTKIIVQTGDPISTGLVPGTLTKSVYGKTEVYNNGTEGPLASHKLGSFRTENGTVEGVRERMKSDAQVGKAEDDVVNEVSDIVDSTTQGGKKVVLVNQANNTNEDLNTEEQNLEQSLGIQPTGTKIITTGNEGTSFQCTFNSPADCTPVTIITEPPEVTDPTISMEPTTDASGGLTLTFGSHHHALYGDPFDTFHRQRHRPKQNRKPEQNKQQTFDLPPLGLFLYSGDMKDIDGQRIVYV